LSLELSGAAWVQEEEFHAKTLRSQKVLAHTGTFLPSPFACRPPSMLLNKENADFSGPLLMSAPIAFRCFCYPQKVEERVAGKQQPVRFLSGGVTRVAA
jgi:hypothetical protein